MAGIQLGTKQQLLLENDLFEDKKGPPRHNSSSTRHCMDMLRNGKVQLGSEKRRNETNGVGKGFGYPHEAGLGWSCFPPEGRNSPGHGLKLPLPGGVHLLSHLFTKNETPLVSATGFWVLKERTHKSLPKVGEYQGGWRGRRCFGSQKVDGIQGRRSAGFEPEGTSEGLTSLCR